MTVAAIDPKTATSEFDRFLVLFDRLVSETNLWIESTPPDKLDWIPVDTPQVRFGDRVSTVTIKSLYVHMAVAEHHWVRGLRERADGDVLPLPRDPKLTERLMSGDFSLLARQMHADDMAVLGDYAPEQLTKTITFAGDDSRWSVMGFLWGMYGHRAYHLGNLDIYLRQSNSETPDFFSFEPKDMA